MAISYNVVVADAEEGLDSTEDPNAISGHANVSFAEYGGEPVVTKSGGAYLEREAVILRDIDYAGVPKVIDDIQDESGDRTLMLERMRGTALSKYISLDQQWNSRPLDEAEAIAIVDGLARCFAAVIRAGYYYRDLNLEHVLVDAEQVSLVDHERDVPAATGVIDTLGGTWETMAPEEFAKDGRMTEASNVYTLGVVLTQLLQGRNPFFLANGGDTSEEDLRASVKALHEAPPRIEVGDPRLDGLINTVLQPDPQMRIQTVTQFRAELAAAAPTDQLAA